MIILAVQRNGTTLVWQNQAYIHMYLYIHTRPGVPAQVLLERFHCRFFSTELLFRMEPASSHCTSLRSSRTLTDFYANFGYTQLSSHHQDRNLKTFPYCQGSSLSQKGPWNSKWYRLGRESRQYRITSCAIGPQKPTQDTAHKSSRFANTTTWADYKIYHWDLSGSIQLSTKPAEPGLHEPCGSDVSQHGQNCSGVCWGIVQERKEGWCLIS